jgi:MarR family
MNSEIRNIFLELCGSLLRVERWNFLTNHAQVLLCLARDPGVRLREVAAVLGITERSAHAIVADLTAAGYVVKQKHGRRNRYQIQAHLPLPEPASPGSAIGDVLALLTGRREAEGSGGAVRSRTPAIPRSAPPPTQHQLSPEESPHDDNRAPRA